MSYTPTIIASYDDLENYANQTDFLNKWFDNDQYEGVAYLELQTVLNYKNFRTIKGTRIFVLEIEFNNPNNVMREVLDECKIEYCLNN